MNFFECRGKALTLEQSESVVTAVRRAGEPWGAGKGEAWGRVPEACPCAPRPAPSPQRGRGPALQALPLSDHGGPLVSWALGFLPASALVSPAVRACFMVKRARVCAGVSP